MPFYVSPEQLMKDRADFAAQGHRPGPLASSSCSYDDGIAFVAENPSRALHKISEIYDRIAFAAVGKYNEFENLRVAGVRLRRHARLLLRPRATSPARGLANAYAQTLGTIFTERAQAATRSRSSSPRSGATADERPDLPADLRRLGGRRARLRRDGRPGRADQRPRSASSGAPGWRCREALDPGRRGRWPATRHGGTPRDRSDPDQLEVAVLDRLRPRRAFRRLAGPLLERLLRPATRRPTSRTPTSDARAARHADRRAGRRPVRRSGRRTADR